jgi:hypothetical protein
LSSLAIDLLPPRGHPDDVRMPRGVPVCRPHFPCPINNQGARVSHIVTITTEVQDAEAVHAACRRLALPEPAHGTFKLFSGEAAGLGVQLPGWRYPLVCDLTTGQIRLDDYGGRWGERQHLDAFMQAYAVEKAKLESHRQGHSVTERLLEDGSIKLTVHVGE